MEDLENFLTVWSLVCPICTVCCLTSVQTSLSSMLVLNSQENYVFLGISGEHILYYSALRLLYFFQQCLFDQINGKKILYIGSWICLICYNTSIQHKMQSRTQTHYFCFTWSIYEYKRFICRRTGTLADNHVRWNSSMNNLRATHFRYILLYVFNSSWNESISLCLAICYISIY